MEFYELIDYGGNNERTQLVETKNITLPSSYPATIAADFNVAGKKKNQSFLGKMIVTYRTPTNEVKTYEKHPISLLCKKILPLGSNHLRACEQQMTL